MLRSVRFVQWTQLLPSKCCVRCMKIVWFVQFALSRQSMPYKLHIGLLRTVQSVQLSQSRQFLWPKAYVRFAQPVQYVQWVKHSRQSVLAEQYVCIYNYFCPYICVCNCIHMHMYAFVWFLILSAHAPSTFENTVYIRLRLDLLYCFYKLHTYF